MSSDFFVLTPIFITGEGGNWVEAKWHGVALSRHEPELATR